ncbi:MAG: PAS domain-containing protein [Candidatus Paceibacterota bacterium]
MNKKKLNKTKTSKIGYDRVGADFFVEFWEESWTYIKTVVDILREPVIILDKKYNVLSANEAFYNLFQVEPKNTEGKNIYKLGNGQWDIPALRKLLQDILPKNTFFKGFEVEHNFPTIGQRTIILNARHIHSKDKTTSELFPPIIMIAMEDVSEIMSIANQLAQYTNQLEKTLNTRTEKLETKISILEKKLISIKK